MVRLSKNNVYALELTSCSLRLRQDAGGQLLGSCWACVSRSRDVGDLGLVVLWYSCSELQGFSASVD